MVTVFFCFWNSYKQNIQHMLSYILLFFLHIFCEINPSRCMYQLFIFSLMYTISLSGYIMSYGCWIVFSLGPLWITLLKTFSCVFFGGHMYSYHLSINPGVKLLSNRQHICLALQGSEKQCSKEFVPFYTPARNVWEFHVCTLFFRLCHDTTTL